MKKLMRAVDQQPDSLPMALALAGAIIGALTILVACLRIAAAVLPTLV